ncbi:restriction endonuclease subunit S [Enterococcus faecium]|uniref:restriction endonuclease subunit S n=1 Tax=Enterococcus faecium TaxID=1352 RepID=UPI002DDD2BED|nr:restriction endonuclease subunit S [Enterococcus faecium]WSI01661.1 restriction endonuclease subunit S [Enterococcus faecium]
MSNDTQPEIRFPEFTDEWEQRKLGEVATRVTRKNKKLESTLPLTISAQFGLVDQNTFFNKQIASKDVSGYYLLKKGEFAYNKSYSNGYPWGAVKRLDKYDMGVLSTLYICFRPVDINSDFLASYYDTDRWYKEVSKHAAEGARNHGLLNIAASDFFETELMIPKNNNEQEKIADFFKSLDTTITLHQRKLDLLKETKKGFLQKMFPKNGAKVPEIRFPGFTGDWEERKFGEIVQVSRGLTYKPSDVQIDGIRVLRSSNINEDVFILRDDDVFVKPDAVNIAPIKNGDILITSANGSSRLVGKHAIVNGLQDKTVHGGFMLRVKSKNTWFTNSLMSSRWYNYFINIYVSGGNGAIGNLRKYDLESQTIIVPDDEEQQKIGAFFKQLDDTIALHQHELDLLKETKKGFLQKMFV